MYITNNVDVAIAVQNAGVDRIFVDLEIRGKILRQGHLDTVISHHQMSDVSRLREVVNNAELLVRLNPLYEGTKEEVDEAIENGADVLMLPMFKEAWEIAAFVTLVNKRAKVSLLLETYEALLNLDDILEVEGIDEIHVGLNDLHLSMKKTFMFELLGDGTVEYASKKIKKRGIRFGFGGIAKIGHGVLPAEMILAEHHRIGSEMAILSRAFHSKSNSVSDLNQNLIVKDEIQKIREMENQLKFWHYDQFLQNQKDVQLLVKIITSKILQETI
jgi:hypothetical protein